MSRTVEQFKAVQRQRNARRWFSVAEWCRDRYIEFGMIGYLHEYHHAMALAKHQYCAARILIGATPHGSDFSASAMFEIESRFDAIKD